ncbi:MAG: LacI family DNA-binding transcriptional regulator [Acidobacteriota bacterium]
MATIKDVARRSGFSPSAVSFVLNDAPLARYMAEESKKRIREAAAELGYHPNQFARSLRSKRSRTIGVVVFDISDPYCTQILRGVEGALYKSGWYLPLLADAQNDRMRFRRYVKMLLERQVEGLIVLGNSVYPENELLQTLLECRTPFVLIGRELESGAVSSVTGDNELGAGMVVEHLYSLGHRNMAFIRGPAAFVDSSQRWKGTLLSAERLGLSIDNRLIFSLDLHNAGHEGGYELTRELLNTGKPFTSLVAYDDLTAFGAIRALTEAGLQVPRDCSVTGYDDLATSTFYNPPLTTIHQDMEIQGATGVGILLDELKAVGNGANSNMPPPHHQRIIPRLVVRGSTAKAP